MSDTNLPTPVVKKRSYAVIAAVVATAGCLLVAVGLLLPASQSAREMAGKVPAKTGRAADKTMAVERRPSMRDEKEDYGPAPAFDANRTTAPNNLSQSGRAYPILREPIPMESSRRPESLDLENESPALDTEQYDPIRC